MEDYMVATALYWKIIHDREDEEEQSAYELLLAEANGDNHCDCGACDKCHGTTRMY